jgi:hypothetical protein
MDQSLYKIANVNRMDPFLMSITSGSDHWMYLSSTGCLTAGRKKAEQALFPYVTDDLLHRNSHFTGPVTVIRIKEGKNDLVWHPFSNVGQSYKIEMNLFKNGLGNIVLFEEINHSLGLTFQYKWQSSIEHGFVRKSILINNNKKLIDIELIDGLRNVMPAGVELRTQQEMSNLANAYKVSEYTPDMDCALFFLNALVMDRPEPGESMYSNLIWSNYNGNKVISLNEKSIYEFAEIGKINEDHLIKGKPGCFLTKIEKKLEPENEIYWYTVGDVYKTQSEITHLISDLKDSSKIEKKLEKSILENHLLLESAVGSADGYQCTNVTINDLHHTANAMFNLFRGGIFVKNYDVQKKDFLRFLGIRNKSVFEKYFDEINAMQNQISIREIIDFGDRIKDSSVRRLCREYLPLIMGRRHGDPSRPWNQFEIRIKHENGNPLLYYEGNWRDIFQNWEALGYSYPQTLESMVCKFINATSMDGYNPYRITSEGIDWEVSDPDDPWGYIGYWNDHQIIYLLKLLEHLQNYDPRTIQSLFRDSIFSYANIPYRIRNFDHIVANPKETIDFDFDQNKAIDNKVAQLGSDGKLILDKDDNVYHVNLIEKILVLLLAKICNLIPGGGIWLNTQRPEWNDANNALVGYGTSMVTVYYMKRFLCFFNSVLKEENPENIDISIEVLTWFNSVNKIISESQSISRNPEKNNQSQMEYISKLGNVFSEYRTVIYDKGFSGKQELAIEVIHDFINKIMDELDNTIELNKDSNGLYHAYNTISLNKKGESVDINHLSLMLEGQVAALSSGSLNIDDSIKLLESLFKSDLYREDMNSFILYPKKDVTPFLNKNIIPSKNISKSKLLTAMLQKDDNSFIEQDAEGVVRFRPEFTNSFDLQAKLIKLRNSDNYESLVNEESNLILQIYEDVFDHRNYTGRSGTMFSYEGIGSIYWHMVSKLLLAVQEIYFTAVHLDEPEEKVKKIGHLYYDIREGLSAGKSSEEYGAFPFDPYSHTPAHSGAQQPGMTGLVKEEILTRFGELGCFVRNRKIHFDTGLLRQSEFLDEPKLFSFYNINLEKEELEINKNQLAYTYCQVPIIYTLTDGDPKIEIIINDCTKTQYYSNKIDSHLSNSIFRRSGKVAQINVLTNADFFNKD